MNDPKHRPIPHIVSLLLLITCVGVGSILWNDPRPLIADDSFFYLKIAENMARGKGSTFSEIFPTNGYHPLWLLVLTFWYSLLDSLHCTAPLHQLRAVVVLVLLFSYGNVLFFFLLLKRFLVHPLYAMLVIPLPLAYLTAVGVYGSEAHINFFMLLCSLLLGHWISESLKKSGRQGHVGILLLFGIVLGLTILARLDNIFFAGGVFITSIFLNDSKKLRRLSASVSIGIGIATPVVPYLVWNLLNFGHLMPISGSIKSTFPHLHFKLPHVHIGAVVFPAAVALGSFLWSIRQRQKTRSVLEKVLPLFIGYGMLLLYELLFTTIGAGYFWYHVQGILLVSILGAWTLQIVLTANVAVSRHLLPRLWLLVILGLGSVIFLARSNLQDNQGMLDDYYRLAAYARMHLPSESVFFITDIPGIFAYWSGMKTISHDGLINDFRYQEDLRELGIACTLKKYGVDYIIIHKDIEAVPDVRREPDYQQAELSGFSSWLYRESAGNLVVQRTDEVQRIGESPLIMWKLRENCTR